MKEKLKLLYKLFISFLKIGMFTFGGGYAMIPLIQKEAVEKNKWVSNEDVLDIIAISESTPGPISVNAATFIGYRVAGFFGALVSTLGLVLPSFIIIYIISFIFDLFKNNEIFGYAFFGIRAGVLALIINALVKMYKQVNKSILSYFIMILAFILTTFFDINVIFVIVFCGIIGFLSSIKMVEGGNEK